MLLPLTLLHCWVVSKPRLLFHFLISGLANGWKLPLLQKLKKNYAIKFVSTVQADFVNADRACFESSLGALKPQSIVHITGDDQNNLVQVCLKQSEHFFYMPRYHSYRITISSWRLKTSSKSKCSRYTLTVMPLLHLYSILVLQR